jgi:RNA polymerase sigma factor (sigma-70 family)
MANTNPSLGPLIEQARDRSAATSERHQAFEAIVRRFEPLVRACTYARLRDPALAEDAAQDAFLLAWQRLDQLREPAAFPGWIRRLALTQCHRRLRRARLEVRPEDDAREVAAATDPAADAERAADTRLVRLALARLAPNDRLVLILFYGCERSQGEIAEWLGVPVTTISRRLAHAKGRMRKVAADALSGGLRGQWKHASESFLVELSARMRGAKPGDAVGIGRLTGRLGLDHVSRVAPPAPACAYLIEDPASGAPIAYAAARQTIFRPIFDLHLAVGEDALKRHAGDVLLTQVVQDMVASDAITLRHATSARHAALVAFLCGRGFQVVERAQDWRLDAAACSARTVQTPSCNGWTFTGIGALPGDAALFDAVLNLVTDAIAEDPQQRAFLPLHPDALRRSLRMQRDGVLAIAGGRLQGLITASVDEVVRDALRLNLVLVSKDQRRRGVASAMLAALLARQDGAPLRLVTPAAAGLTDWLTSRGFVEVGECLKLERLLRKAVPVAPELLDEYVGRYVVEGRPGDPIVIERHGDTLISKTRDMRDVLLASSASEFFTRHHDGRGRFERDATGRVARLVIREGTREFIAMRRSQ